MELFENFTNPINNNKPLYSKIRPKDFADFFGQKSIEPFLPLIKNDKLPSIILWGPPGCGKTTLANIIKNQTQKDFVFLSAVLSGKKEVKETVDRAKSNLRFREKQTILFIDEIHRFNKAQQDALLPHIEDGTFVLIGATTENPSFEVIPALLSRCKVIRFDSLADKDILSILTKAKQNIDTETKIEESALKKIATISAGDARFAINLLETCFENIKKTTINDNDVIKLLGNKSIKYDKLGEAHYDNISAFIKSVRGSDPDAAIYYLARMLESGEDPKFIVRRLIILASEDIGNADPRALQIAVSAKEAIHFVGMPESRIILAQATTYLATAPKSNKAYLAIEKALKDIRDGKVYPPPLHLRNPVTKLMKEEGYGKNYKYAHDFPHHVVAQQYLPQELKGHKYYIPSESGYEKHISAWMKKVRTTFM